MAVQIIQDGRGKAAGVFIPINQWEELKKKHNELAALEVDANDDKNGILRNLKETVEELKMIERGKLKARPAKQLLDEL